MATLCEVREDGSIAERWELGGQPFVIGRSEEAHAHVEDASTSRRHSVILPEGEHYVIEDLGSQNGTWVDGRRVLAARLSHNTRIVVGRTQLIFLEHRPSAVTSPAGLPGPDTPVRPATPVTPIGRRARLVRQS